LILPLLLFQSLRLSLVKFYLIYLLIEKAKSLEESAREFQAKYEKKTELKEVEIKTGEEGESNVLQVSSSSSSLFDLNRRRGRIKCFTGKLRLKQEKRENQMFYR
jgi:hypothetical protein